MPDQRARQLVPRAIAAMACLLVTITAIAPFADAADYGPPSAPIGVNARMTKDGVLVSWAAPSGSSPAIANYIVHAGQNSCPIMVPADATSATMPIVRGQGIIVPAVRAVNAYGYSPDTRAATALDVRGRDDNVHRAVQFLQFSDFHGALETSDTNIGAAVLASALTADRARVQPTFTVSSGDNFGGAPAISSVFDEVPSIKVLNAMKLDVSTFGNHEHDRPLAFLRGMIERSDFPWVVSNYSTLAPLQGKRNGAEDYVLVKRGGITVGFVGMNTADVPKLVFPTNLKYGRDLAKSIAVSPSAAALVRDARAARAAGANIVVALLHEGFATFVDGQPKGRLVELAAQLPGVDLVYGAHTHLKYAGVIHGKPVTQSPNSGIEYSRTTTCLDTATGRVLGSNVEHLDKDDVARLPEDRKVAAIVSSYKDQLGTRLDQRIGVVNGIFPGRSTASAQESDQMPMGDFLADALRDEYGTDFVLINAGGIRDTLPAGGYQSVTTGLRRPGSASVGPYDVVLGDVQAVFPFGNNAATTTITGEGLWSALEARLAALPAAKRVPQVSGLRYAFDPNLPAGSRLVSVTKPDGTPIGRDGTRYTITTIDYLVYGGDGYTAFSPTDSIIRRPIVDSLTDRLRADLAAGRVTEVPLPDGRITRIRN